MSTFTVVEQLNAYKQSGGLITPYAGPPKPGTNVAPNGAIGDGAPPFPATTKKFNRTTNISIPVARRAGVPAEDIWAHHLRHGEICLSHSKLGAGNAKTGTWGYSNVYAISYANDYMKSKGDIFIGNVQCYSLPVGFDMFSLPFGFRYPVVNRNDDQSQYAYDVQEGDLGIWLPEAVKFWSPDGVVNVLDELGGGDDVTNVTVQGPATTINGDDRGRPRQRICSRADMPLTRLYIGLRCFRHVDIASGNTGYTFELELFSGGDIARETNARLNNFGPPPEGSPYSLPSKLVKVWQYGTLVDTRHVESSDEQRAVVNVFVNPPMTYRPEQRVDEPRLTSMPRANGPVGPPNGHLWLRCGRTPPKNTRPYNGAADPSDPATAIRTALEQSFTTYTRNNANDLVRYMNQATWEALVLPQTHSVNAPSLFYDMHVRTQAGPQAWHGVYWVPIPELPLTFRNHNISGAYNLPFLAHGKARDRWATVRTAAVADQFPAAAIAAPARAPPPPPPPGTPNEADHGRRPAWEQATVEMQLWQREVPHKKREQYDYMADPLNAHPPGSAAFELRHLSIQ